MHFSTQLSRIAAGVVLFPGAQCPVQLEDRRSAGYARHFTSLLMQPGPHCRLLVVVRLCWICKQFAWPQKQTWHLARWRAQALALGAGCWVLSMYACMPQVTLAPASAHQLHQGPGSLLRRVGCLAEVHQLQHHPDGRRTCVAVGEACFSGRCALSGMGARHTPPALWLVCLRASRSTCCGAVQGGYEPS